MDSLPTSDLLFCLGIPSVLVDVEDTDIQRRLTDKSNNVCTYMGCRLTIHPIDTIRAGMRLGHLLHVHVGDESKRVPKECVFLVVITIAVPGTCRMCNQGTCGIGSKE